MEEIDDSRPWYDGITRYQWLVLIIACLGWIFDVFEGQIFVATMRDSIPELLKVAPEHPSVSKWNDWAFASFAFGGAIGGLIFGVMSDKIGRSKTMMVTILFYSFFTLFQAFVTNPTQLMILRFFVAMGVGGEWAVASAMVAEVMPNRSRHVTSSIFHASSVAGTLIAAFVGAVIVAQLGWRYGFAVGVLPALLTLWIRWKLKEPKQWQKAKKEAAQDKTKVAGRFSELFHMEHLRNTLVGVALASIGLTTFWGCHIYGKNALLSRAQKQALIAEDVPSKADTSEMKKQLDEGAMTQQQFDDAVVPIKKAHNERVNAAYKKHSVKTAEMWSMAINALGGGLGLVLFGWFANRLGRKGAFIMYHLLGFVCAIVMFLVLIPSTMPTYVLGLFLPVFGFFTLGMHAGYAVYFPELFPTRLRGTGAGFCFNGGRILQGVAFFGIGALGLASADKALYLAPLYLLGIVVVLFARETRGEELQD